MSSLRKLARTVCKSIGVHTSYHISAVYSSDIGMVTSSMILNVNPWIHNDNYHEVVSFVRDQVEKTNSTPTITSITKLGI